MVTWDDFDKIWASTSPLTPYEFSDHNYSQGWNFVGSTPPARQMWDSIQKKNDEKFKYLRDNFGTPNIVTDPSDMTDTSKIYVYLGSEVGWTNGDWYYYDEGTSSWVSGGVYNSVAFVTDTTLSIAGQPADAKAVGDALALKADIAGCTFTGNISTSGNLSVAGTTTLSGTTTAPTASAGDNSTNVATTAFVKTAINNNFASIELGMSGLMLGDPDLWEIGMILDNGMNNGAYDWAVRTIGFIRGVGMSVLPSTETLESTGPFRVKVFKYTNLGAFVEVVGTYSTLTEIPFTEDYLYRLLVFYGSDYHPADKSQLLSYFTFTGNVQFYNLNRILECFTSFQNVKNIGDATLWEMGNINDNTGANDSPYNWICRTKDFINAGYFTFTPVDPSAGWKIKIFRYTKAGVFVDHSSPIDIKFTIGISDYKYRIIAFKGNTTLFNNPADALSHFFVNGIAIFDDDTLRTVLDDSITTMTPSDGNTTCVDRYDLTGLSWNAVGDSLTEGYYGEESQLYVAKVASKTGLVANNCGIGGRTIAVNNTYLQNQSIVEMVCGLNGATAYPNADIWTVMGGYNDQLYATPLGDINSTDVSTIYGALKAIVTNIQSRTNNPKLLLISPLQSNRNGSYMLKLRQAFYDVAELYGIAFLDLYSIGGFSANNVMRLTHDGVHPTPNGTNMFYKKIVKAIENL